MSAPVHCHAARGRERLQRLFSAFPAGWPGCGLLLLRVAAGAIAVVEGASVALYPGGATPAGVIVGGIAVLAGVALILGVLVPLAGGLIAAIGLGLSASLLPVPPNHPLDDAPSLVLLTAVAIAIVLLGPGALSVDSYLFGRREIVIPHDHRSTNAGGESE